MIKHIVIAVDGSGPSRHAARYGLTLATQAGARVTLLSVLPPPELIPIGPLTAYVPMNRTPGEDEVARIKTLFEEISTEHTGVQVAHAVELGPVSETICDYAAHNDADLIVVGARGLGAARRILLGSISQQVVQHAHCPVLVWRQHRPDEARAP
jgi:nucleotide-binding universal stress UspA family protein